MRPLALGLRQSGQAGLAGPGRRLRRIEIRRKVRRCVCCLRRPLAGHALRLRLCLLTQHFDTGQPGCMETSEPSQLALGKAGLSTGQLWRMKAVQLGAELGQEWAAMSTGMGALTFCRVAMTAPGEVVLIGPVYM